MGQIAGTFGLIGVLIALVFLFVLGVLGILMPLYIYQIRNRTNEMLDEIRALKSITSNLKKAMGNPEFNIEQQSELLEETRKTNQLLEDFISRLQ